MANAVHRALGIQAQDSGKLARLGPIFFLAGLIYNMGTITSKSLFVSRIGSASLPLMFLVEAAILPLQLWFVSYLSQKMPQGSLIRRLFLIILAGMAFCGLFACSMVLFHFQWRGFYPLLFIMGSVLLRIFVPLMWMLGNGICLLQQAKRLFPILSALFSLGSACAGLLTQIIPVFLAKSATEIMLLLVPATLFFSLFLWRRVIADYFLTTDLETADNHGTPMNTVIRNIRGMPLLRLTLLGFVILMGLFYIVDYLFFMFASRAYPGSDDLTRFYGMFVAALYSISLLIGLLLNRLIKRIGIGKTVLLMGITTVAVLTGAGLMAGGRWPLQAFTAADLLLDVLCFTLLPMINEVFYKLLPAAQRAGASLLFAGSINALGKLLSSAITGLHSAKIISLTALSLIGIGMALGYFFLTTKQKRLYIATLLGGMQSHIVSLPELESFAPGKMIGKRDLLPLQEALQNSDPTKQLIALEFCAQIKNEALFPAIKPFLTHPDPPKRLLALQALPDNLPGLAEFCLRALRDPDQEIRCEAIRRLKLAREGAGVPPDGRSVLPDDRRLEEIFINQLGDSSPSVIRETMIALSQNAAADPDLKTRLRDQIRAMLAGDDESRYQICQAVQAVQATEHAVTILEMAQRESSSRVRIAAVNCLGGLGFHEAIPWFLTSYSSADRELQKSIERALLEMGSANAQRVTACLAEGLDRSDMDAWYLRLTVLAGLDRERRFEKMINQNCHAKLKRWRVANIVPEVLEKAGMTDLAALYRKRATENRHTIFKACWQTLAVYFDPVVVQRLQPAFAHSGSAEKWEQGVEILTELSDKYPLTAEMAAALQDDPPAAGQQPLSFPETLQRTKSEFPDYWLDSFADYALTHFKEVEGGA